MAKTDREVLELCLSWFQDIVERSEKLTSGNVAHGSKAIRGVAKNYAEFVGEHLNQGLKINGGAVIKINAPEKIYIHPDIGGKEFIRPWLMRRANQDSIEYIRTDAFIEKAAQWLKENLLNHTYVYEGEVGIGMAVFLEDFKKAMKL